MKNFILLIAIVCSQALWAKNIILLSSLPQEDIRTTLKVKKLFNKKLFGLEDHNLIYIDKADQEVIYRYLNDPETMALFWLSHGGFKRIRGNSNSAIKPTPILFDHNKDNVAKAFQKIHPNIKYISIIGCNSAQILAGTLEKRPDLGYYVPTKKVVATWAFRRAIRRFKKHFWNVKYNYLLEEVVQEGVKIKIERTVSQDSKSLKVLAGKQLIGILPKLKSSESQIFEYYIPYTENLSKRDLKIVLSSGQAATDATNNFGDIVITSSDRHMWKIFAKPNGEPFGVNERIFLFKDQLSNISDVQDYIQYQAH